MGAIRAIGLSRGRVLEPLLVFGLLLAALALRTYRLGAPTLTGDEWFMLRNAQEGPGWIVHQAHTFEPHPLLYYLGFWAWVAIAGSTEWAMRFPSVLFGVLTCAAVWRIARDAAGRGVGLAALLLSAVNPYQVAHSQNARNYAMVSALSAVATGLLLVAARRGGSSWYGYGLALLLALNTHLNAGLAAAAHAAWVGGRWLLRGERPDRAAFRTAAAVAVLFGAWLVYQLPALTAYPGYFPEPVGLVEVLRRTVATFVFGQIDAPRRLLVGSAAGLVGLAAVWTLWHLARNALPFRSRIGRLATHPTLTWSPASGLPISRPGCAVARDDAALLVLLVAGVPVFGAALMFLVRPMFEERYLIVAAPATIAAIAMGLGVLARAHRAIGAVALAALVYLSVPFLQRYYPATEAARPDWRGLAGWISSTARSGDVVLITGHGVADLFGYYRQGSTPTLLAADPSTAAMAYDALQSTSATGVFHLPYLDAEPDQIVRERLIAVGFPAENRWFRSQRAEYFALPGRGLPGPRPVGARWAGTIELRGASVGPARVAPGGLVDVALEWATLEAAPDLKLSVRLLGPDGKQVAQVDRRPADETRPFPTIRPGETARDGHALRLPLDSAPGRYEAVVLLYQPSDAKALMPIANPAVLRSDNPELVRLGSVDLGRP